MDYNQEALKVHEQYKGKLRVECPAPLKTRDDLSVAYTPGVAEPCRKIAANEEEVYRYTTKGHMVAVVTDGTAVLGLGDIGPKAALRGGSLFGLKFMLNDVKKEVPFDEETFAHGGMRVFAVATNVETGKPAYFEKGKTDFPFDEAARASASLPLASVPVVLDGQPYLDGGCSCPIALNWALNEGFEKIVVITTRQKGFRKAMPGQKMVDLYDDFYSDKPLFLADMLTQELRYNTLMDQLDELEADGRICCVRPQEPITIGRFEGDENKLLDLYNRGHREGREALDKVRGYLET